MISAKQTDNLSHQLLFLLTTDKLSERGLGVYSYHPRKKLTDHETDLSPLSRKTMETAC